MPLEIEIKIAVPSHAPLTTVLQQCGATRVGAYFEFNRMFDLPGGEMRAARRGLRIREYLPRDGCIVRPAVMTYKGSPASAKIKTREEIECEVGNAAAATALLESLGYEVTLCFEKRRTRWQCDGCTVELDEVPRLGTFVEVEGPDGESVERVAVMIGLNVGQAVRGSYARLLAEDAQRRGESRRDFRF